MSIVATAYKLYEVVKQVLTDVEVLIAGLDKLAVFHLKKLE